MREWEGLPGVSTQPGCMTEKWMLVWVFANCSVITICCLWNTSTHKAVKVKDTDYVCEHKETKHTTGQQQVRNQLDSAGTLSSAPMKVPSQFLQLLKQLSKEEVNPFRSSSSAPMTWVHSPPHRLYHLEWMSMKGSLPSPTKLSQYSRYFVATQTPPFWIQTF